MSDPSASVEPVEVKKSSIDEEWLSQDCLRRLKEKLQVSLKQAFRKLAKVLFGLFSDVKKVCTHPKRTLVIYFIVLLISLLGFLRLNDLKNNDIADLFTPSVCFFGVYYFQNSESHTEKETYEEYFTPSDDSFNIIAVPVRKGNIFSDNDALLELLDLEKSLMDITVEGKHYEGI